jgi:hypothetical protein
MRSSNPRHHAFAICAVAATIAGCGGSQAPIGATGAMPLSSDHAQKSPGRNAGRGKGTVEFAYVVNVYSNNVSAYTINPSNGALTQVQGSPFAAGDEPAGIATCEVEHHRCVPPTL